MTKQSYLDNFFHSNFDNTHNTPSVKLVGCLDFVTIVTTVERYKSRDDHHHNCQADYEAIPRSIDIAHTTAKLSKANLEHPPRCISSTTTCLTINIIEEFKKS